MVVLAKSSSVIDQLVETEVEQDSLIRVLEYLTELNASKISGSARQLNQDDMKMHSIEFMGSFIIRYIQLKLTVARNLLVHCLISYFFLKLILIFVNHALNIFKIQVLIINIFGINCRN